MRLDLHSQCFQCVTVKQNINKLPNHFSLEQVDYSSSGSAAEQLHVKRAYSRNAIINRQPRFVDATSMR